MKHLKKIPIGVWAIILLCLLYALICKNKYFITLFVFCGTYIIAVSGLDILFGFTGQISMGHAMFYAIGAYTTAIATLKFGLPAWIGILFSLMISSGFAALLAIPASKLVNQFLSLLTIATSNMIYVFLTKCNYTGAMRGLKSIPQISLFGIVLDSKFKFGIFVLILIVIMLFIKYRIINSSTGRAFMAIRENVIAANGIGINVRKYKVMAFVISAIFTTLSGCLYAHFVGYISPEGFNSTQSTTFMTMLLFGGCGNMVGPIFGAVSITLVSELLQGFNTYKALVYGCTILVSVLFMPRGVYGLVSDSIEAIKHRGRKAGGDKC